MRLDLTLKYYTTDKVGTFKKSLVGKINKLGDTFYVDKEVEEENPRAKRFEIKPCGSYQHIDSP